MDYLQRHREVTSVLMTGGDPMIMRTAALRRYVEPLLEADGLDHVDSIRFGTKAPPTGPTASSPTGTRTIFCACSSRFAARESTWR